MPRQYLKLAAEENSTKTS